MLEEEGEDDFHLKIGKTHPGAAVYAPSKPNQAMRLARLIVLRREPFRTILVRVRKYLRHPMREGWCRKHQGVLRNAEALPGKSLSGLAHQGEGDRMESNLSVSLKKKRLFSGPSRTTARFSPSWREKIEPCS